jgi:hypothetical protein
VTLRMTGDTIEGIGIPWGDGLGPWTDLSLDMYPEGRPLVLGKGTQKIGEIDDWDVTPAGLWLRAQIAKAERYRELVRKLLTQGARLATGTMPHLVRRSADKVTAYPWIYSALVAADDGQLISSKSADLDWGDLPGPVKMLVAIEEELERRERQSIAPQRAELQRHLDTYPPAPSAPRRRLY